MSDRYGRKYLVLTALTWTMITSIIFGMSHSLPAMLTARALGGAGSGTVGIIRTMVAEMVPEKSLQPRAFSLMPLVWAVGSCFGPSFGGALANPARQYPGVFGHSSFFRKWPFLLPNLVSSIFFLVGLTTGILFLKETLEAKKHRKDYGLILGNLVTSPCRKPRHPRNKPWQSIEDSEPLLGEEANGTEVLNTKNKKHLKAPTFRDVLTPQSRVNLVAYTMLAMHSQAFDQLLPIFMHHPTQNITEPSVTLPFKFAGGFGITSGRIGLLFTMYGVAGMLIQFLIFPPVAKKYGVLRCFKWVALTFPMVYALVPFTSLLPTPFTKQAFVFILMLVKCWCGIFAFPCSTILLTNSASSLAILGTLNGVATSTSAVGRAAGPFLAGTVFTFGVDVGYVITPFWLLTLISLCAAIPIWYLKEMPGFSASDDSTDEEDEEIEFEAEEDSTNEEQLNDHNKINAVNESAIDSDDDADDEIRSIRTGRTLSKEQHHEQRVNLIERRMSSPIGIGDIGPRIARRFSNNLGATRAGFGSGSGVGGSG
ncbi:putative mfs transporter [Phaeomoniella chlamydospora]|uniref:Putative mfs transporter n=1 Tax=Phaeomoniella chlamydospora TaxID=158046 RepID=A0A0G2DUP7_PHACM|nr:putative mfs transporter [Phaeomoniella chlamydospora]